MPSEEERMGMRGPGQHLTREPESLRAIREKLDLMQGEAPSRGGYEAVAPLAVSVNAVIKQRDALCALCGEMIATLQLPANAEMLPSELAPIVVRWKGRFEKHSGEPK